MRWQLRDISKVSDPRFAAVAQRASGLLAGLEERKAQALTALEQAFQQAQQLLQCHDYDLAAAALRHTPAILRKPEVQALLDSAQALRDEAVALAVEIRAAVASKRYDGLLVKLDRLLALKPNHTNARKLAKQLLSGFLARARRCVADHRYEAAVAALDAIPSSLSNPEVLTLSEQAHELACLMAHVRSAALADETICSLECAFSRPRGRTHKLPNW